MWSFVPSLEGTFAPSGYLDVLASVERNLVFGVRELDGDAFPGNVTHVGPVLEPEGPDAGWMPPSRSLVAVSLGTTDMGERDVLQRVLDGLVDSPVSVVATIGTHLDPSSFRVPPNAQLSGFVRHAAVLPHADVFVGHGGHGGIMAALTFGVPIVSIPLDRDQPHNAARVESVGAGRAVSKDADPATIAAAVEAVRTGSHEREHAHRMASAIAAYGDTAVTTIEAMLS